MCVRAYLCSGACVLIYYPIKLIATLRLARKKKKKLIISVLGWLCQGLADE